MTIFDTLKYPIRKVPGGLNISSLPSNIVTYWQEQYNWQNIASKDCINHLKRLLLEYDTDKCEITNPCMFKSHNTDLYK